MSNIVAGYIRVSSRGQEKGFGKDLQLKAIVDLCKLKNLSLSSIYHDSAVSGTEKAFEERNGFYQLIEDCCNNNIDTIVIYDLSRLWRDDFTKVMIKKLLLKNKIKIISFNQPHYSLESTDATEYLMFSMLDALATFERMQIITRLSAGRKSKLLQGKFSGGGVSLGYRAENKDLVIDEKEMKLVKKIFALKKKGGTTYSIAKKLREEGIVGKLGGKIEPATIRKILKSKLYKGYLKYGGATYKALAYKVIR